MRSSFKHLVVFSIIAGLALVALPAFSSLAQNQSGDSGAAATASAAPTLVGSDLGLPGKLGQAVAKAPQGTGKGQIDPQAAPGYLGIPGGKQISLVTALLWSVLVGWVFSTVGAFGGVLAGVGHISVFGLGA